MRVPLWNLARSSSTFLSFEVCIFMSSIRNSRRRQFSISNTSLSCLCTPSSHQADPPQTNSQWTHGPEIIAVIVRHEMCETFHTFNVLFRHIDYLEKLLEFVMLGNIVRSTEARSFVKIMQVASLQLPPPGQLQLIGNTLDNFFTTITSLKHQLPRQEERQILEVVINVRARSGIR